MKKYEVEIENFLSDYDPTCNTKEIREILFDFSEYLDDYFTEKIKRSLQ